MDRKLLDRLAPLVYAGLIVALALFFRVALAPIAIFGALAMAAYYTAIRQRLLTAERASSDETAFGRGISDDSAADDSASDDRPRNRSE